MDMTFALVIFEAIGNRVVMVERFEMESLDACILAAGRFVEALPAGLALVPACLPMGVGA